MIKVRKNIKNIKIIPFILLILVISNIKGYTQEIEVFTGKSDLFLDENFSVTIFFSKENKREFKAYRQFFFPDIADFEKGRTVYQEEEDPKAYKIVQYYKPRRAGIFTINPVRIKIKDKIYASKSVKITVSPKNRTIKEDGTEVKIEDKDLEFEAPKLDAILDIYSTKTKVYTGEGFGVTVSFLIAIQNKTEITFIDLNDQRKEFIKKMKASGCFIEDFAISAESVLDTITVRGKKYVQWKLYEGVFFPLDSNAIKIPALSFSVLTYSLAKNKNESMERKALLKKFYTHPLLIKVKALPKNKVMEQIPVGYFSLNESVYPAKIWTGKSFKYTFTILGEGNISALPEPAIFTNENFDIYAPKITQEISHQQGRITGVKSFVYYVTPKEPGDFKLSDYFKWPYFNSVTGQYDSLTSSLSLKVRGESLKNNYISVNNPADFYARIDTDSNRLRLFTQDNDIKYWADMFIVVMLISTVVLVVKK